MELVLSNKRISIGIVLYIAVFLVSGIWSPWQMDGLTVDDFTESFTKLFTELFTESFTESADNMVMDIVPVNILYFGIYELMQIMLYVKTAYAEDMNDGVMFMLSIYASFTYMQYILREFIVGEDSEDISIPAKLVIEFIYDNILTYISCLIVYYAYPLFWKVLPKVLAAMEIEENSRFLDILVWVIVIFLLIAVIIPGALQFLKLIVYMLSMSLIIKLLNYMDHEIEWHMILKTALIFATAFVLIMIVNIVVNLILDRIIGRVVEEIEGFIISIPGDIKAIGGFLLGILKFTAIITGVIAVIMLIFYIAGKFEGVF